MFTFLDQCIEIGVSLARRRISRWERTISLVKQGKVIMVLESDRVTRLGENSPYGGLFTLCSYLIITISAHIFLAAFSTVKFAH
jgi:hypothetical protein